MRLAHDRSIAATRQAQVRARDRWAQSNRHDDQERRARALALTPAERLRLGESLSGQALKLLAAAVREGHGPVQAPSRS
jgi:hypothetical protein